ncbi:hypothetical protein A0J57_18120 [Sphingobium sp. 22B]|nr:hypothetical protein A0J57_18120 [Sphingobium sp. 22B]OAP30441.1 hypothetical protein A8O16_18410 [Sphingobium sp. 20006FA]
MNKLFRLENGYWTATGPWDPDMNFVPTIRQHMPELRPGDWHWKPLKYGSKISFRTKELADQFIDTGLFVILT